MHQPFIAGQLHPYWLDELEMLVQGHRSFGLDLQHWSLLCHLPNSDCWRPERSRSAIDVLESEYRVVSLECAIEVDAEDPDRLDWYREMHALMPILCHPISLSHQISELLEALESMDSREQIALTRTLELTYQCFRRQAAGQPMEGTLQTAIDTLSMFPIWPTFHYLDADNPLAQRTAALARLTARG